MDIKEKINIYLKIKGIGQTRFEKAAGLSRGQLAQKQGLNAKSLELISAYATDLNMEWLIAGRGEMLNAFGKESGVSAEVKNSTMSNSVVQQGINISGDNNSFNPNDITYLHKILAEKDSLIEQKEQYIIKLRKQSDEAQDAFNTRIEAKDVHYQKLADGLRKIITDKECAINKLLEREQAIIADKDSAMNKMLDREQEIVRSSYERNKENVARFDELRKEKDAQIERLLCDMKAKDERIERLTEILINK
jgi:hypothetical protein